MSKASLPIGLFDSGVGGLTVVRRVMELLPRENIVYFGDTARVPYGSKSNETVTTYSLQAAAFLESLGVKMIIIACNTASAVALEQVRSASSVPVIGVVHPAARTAIETTKTGIIGIIATEGAVRSNAYQGMITTARPDMKVFAQACPLFVAFAEEGLDHHPATMLMAREYLTPLLARSIDTLILGCTHYPLLVPSIASVTGSRVTLVDPGVATAAEARELLEAAGLLNTSASLPRHEYYLSDFPHKFVEIGSRFLGHQLRHVHRITLDELANFA
ncbi:MAG: glutamate racemase [Candidatus Kapaibacterium sp.]